MKINDIVNTIITLSQRTDLNDNKPTVLYYLNKVRLVLFRERRYNFNQETTTLELKANKRTVDLPSTFLHSPVIRRNKASVTVNDATLGNITKQQFLFKYIDKPSFDADFPELDASGNKIVGIPNAFVINGATIFFGTTPKEDEELYFDFYSALEAYTIAGDKEDQLAIKGYDYLIAATLEEIYTSWIISDKLKALWATETAKAMKSLKKLQVFDEANMQLDIEMEEPG